jgi:hypothetical protein
MLEINGKYYSYNFSLPNIICHCELKFLTVFSGGHLLDWHVITNCRICQCKVSLHTHIPWLHKFVMATIGCGISRKDTKHTETK